MRAQVGVDHTPTKHDHLATRDAHACCSSACQPITSEEPMAVQASSWAVQQPGPSGGVWLVKGTSLQLYPLSLLVSVQQRQEITHFERWSKRILLATLPVISLTQSNKHTTRRKKSEMAFRLFICNETGNLISALSFPHLLAQAWPFYLQEQIVENNHPCIIHVCASSGQR